MGYGVKIYQAACKELEDRRRRAEEKAAACRERFFEDCPRAAQIREEMARNASGAARAVLSGGDVRQELTRMKERGMALREEYNGAKRAEPGGRNPAVSVFQLPGQRLCGRPHVPVLKILAAAHGL